MHKIELSPDAMAHLRLLTARDRKTILNGIEEYLSHEPLVETRNRKPMRPNPIAPWELRLGNFRVYYDVEEGPDGKVLVRAVGVKLRNVVKIGQQEYYL